MTWILVVCFRAEGALTIECERRTYGTLDFLLFAQTQILGFWEIFEFLLAEMECVFIDSDAPVGPVPAPWIVSKTLIVIGRVGRGLVDQN